MRIIALLAIAAATSLVACNKKVEKKKESYSYELSENGCATGKHTFSSVGAMCVALADDATNRGCAYNLRYQMAQQYKCPQTLPKPAAPAAPPAPSGSEARGRPSAERFSYQFVVNGCDTGLRTFDNKAELCTALADDVSNNNCAADLRREMSVEKGCR